VRVRACNNRRNEAYVVHNARAEEMRLML